MTSDQILIIILYIGQMLFNAWLIHTIIKIRAHAMLMERGLFLIRELVCLTADELVSTKELGEDHQKIFDSATDCD